jgi:hypothetical protein
MNLRIALDRLSTINDSWSFTDDIETYENLIWPEDNETTKPTLSECQTIWDQMTVNLPMADLRSHRDSLLLQCDWVVIRAYSQGVEVPSEWATYMQALRDLPANVSATLDSNLVSITNMEIFPAKPSSA